MLLLIISAWVAPNELDCRNDELWRGMTVHSVIKFSSVSFPEWLRNSLWCTSRFDILPQD